MRWHLAAQEVATVKSKTEKLCPRCGRVKRMTEFGLNVTAPGGRAGWCRACMRSYARDRREKYRAENMAAREAEKSLGGPGGNRGK